MAGQRGLATKIRTGLEPDVTVASTPKTKTAPTHYLDEIWIRKPIRRHVSEFSCVIAIVLLVIGISTALKGGSLANVAALVTTALFILLLGYKVPTLLHPVWKSWMTLATGLGLVMTTLILSIGWAIVMIPTALLMRVLGKRIMDLSYASSAPTYWETRDPKFDDFKLLERQF